MSKKSIKSWLGRFGTILGARPSKPRLTRRRLGLRLEFLEERWLPSNPSTTFLTDFSAGQTQAAGTAASSGITPAQMQTAYGLNTVMFGSAAGNGAGQTIAVVDSYNQPNIVGDLTAFDQAFGLQAPPSFKVENQSGGSTLPANATGNFGVEISLDVEWAHAMAPAASIVLVEANSSGFFDLFNAVNIARNTSGVSVVNMCWYGSEAQGVDYDWVLTTPSGHNGITFVTASGDEGGAWVSYPGSSPNVVSVGGTDLSIGTGGAWAGETAWSGSGGGISGYETQPSFQTGIVTQSTTMRGVPDVAMDAGSGVPVYDSYDEGAATPWTDIGGTSLAAPMFSGLMAVADQGRALAGLGTLDGPSQTLPKLYSLAGSGAFHDITSGSNGTYSAGPGYDLVTGLGSPVANVLIPDLVGQTGSPTATTSTLTDIGPNPSTFGQSVSFTISISPSVPNGETVGLIDTSNQGATVGTGTLANGAATITVSNLGPGQHVLEVEYSGDSSYLASTSSTVTQAVNSAPAVTTQPGNQTIAAGNLTSFTASASGYPSPSVQWQVNTGSGFTNLANGGVYSGTTTTTLTITGATAAMNGYQYQAVFTNGVGSATSNAAALTVDFAPGITTQPVNQIAEAGGNAHFSAAAGGNPAATVQWQASTNGGATWANIGGATSTTLTLAALVSSQNGYEFRAVFTNIVGSTPTSAATLSVDYVTIQPGGIAVNVGQNATFAVGSSNPGDTVQWQANTGSGFTNLANGGVYSGATTATLTITGATAAMNGYQYQAIFTNTAGTVTTSSATLTVAGAPAVTTQPVNQTVNSGGNTTFVAAASGNPAPTVQWQVNTGAGFINLSNGGVYSGVTTGTLTISGATATMNGYQYQAVFTNGVGSATSNAGTLTVDFAPGITTQPANQIAEAGGNAHFSAAAGGNPAATVQWQVSTNGGATWANIGGATSTTLTLSGLVSSQNGYEFRAVFTNTVGSTPTSAATITVDSVITQPSSITVNVGQNAAFTVGSSNPGDTVQWQANTGSGFTNLANGGVYNGATTTTLTITGATAAMNGYQYQAIFTNTAGTVTTSSATLTVAGAPAVTTQPVNQTVNAGGNTTFVAAAGGNPAPTIQWQVNTGAGFINLSNGGVYSGATTGTLTISGATATMNDYQYQAVFTNGVGSATSNVGTLTVDFAPAITTQPANQIAEAGGNAHFSAAAGGNPAATVQWQASTNGGATWTNIGGATSTTLTLSGLVSSQNGYEFRAVFTNTVGSTPTSAATITVDSVITQPSSITVNVGQNAAFTVGSSNPGDTVQWQVSTGSGFTNLANGGVYNGATTTTLTITGATAAMNGYQYQAVFTNTAGTVTTRSAMLTVAGAPAVTTQPVNQTVNAGGNTTFVAAAGGNPAPTIQWQVNMGAGFINLSNGGVYSGTTTGTLTISGATATMNDYQYQAVFTNGVGSATSNVGTLTVDFAPAITTQPANQIAEAGGNAHFSAAAGGNPAATVQWQASTNGGATWTNITGAASTTLALSSVVSSQNGYEYRAVFTNSVGSTPTSAATLTVDYVTIQPSSIAVNVGQNATFTVGSSNPGDTVQWQANTGSGFANLANGAVYSGATTTTLTITGTAGGMNGDQYRAIFTNTAGTLTTSFAILTVNLTNPLLGAYETSSTVSLTNLIPNPAGTVAYGAALVDPLYAVRQQYGLTTLDLEQSFNYRGEQEKYLQSGNGSNSAHGGYYVLMPTGNLYAWDGVSLPTTLAQAPVAAVGAAVYNDPLLLTSNTGVPIAAVDNPLYDLKIQLGLVTPVTAVNTRGANEKYLVSGNGSNGANGGLYMLLPNDTLVAWTGSPYAAGTLVANLSAFGNVYATPSLLYAAEPGTAVGVTDSIVNGVLTLTPAAGFDRSITVTATAAASGTTVSESFTYTVNDTPPSFPTVSSQSTAHNVALAPFNLGAVGSAGATLTYSATVAGFSPLYNIKVEFGLTQPDIASAFNFRGGQEKYFQSTNGSNSAHGGYYILMPGGGLYAWDGNSMATTATAANLAADPGTVVYANTALLYGAQAPNAPTVFSNQGTLYDTQEQYGLNTADVASAFNYRGGDEKYLRSGNGSNSANGGYYVLLPDGLLYAWNGTSLATTVLQAPVANLSGAGVYANPALLYNAQPTAINDPLYAIKEEYGLYTADVASAFNYRGGQEKYFQSGNGGNPANGGYYVLMPNNDLYAWNGVSLSSTILQTPAAQFGSTDVYDNPWLLYSDVGQTPAVTASVSSAGLLTITQSAFYAGTAQVNIAVSDGAATTTQSFMFNSTDTAPVLPPVAAVNVSSASGSTAINLNASEPGTSSGSLQFAATVAGFNSLYALKAQLGLTGPDIAAAFNIRGGNEKYFQSTNGGNSANGGYYVLMPTGNLYAWNGVSLASTVAAANLVGTLGTAVYANTALLYNAPLPVAPPLAVGITNTASGGTLQLSWPSGYTGRFMIAVSVGDGISQTQQSFLVTVS